jgi:hypothetical protein
MKTGTRPLQNNRTKRLSIPRYHRWICLPYCGVPVPQNTPVDHLIPLAFVRDDVGAGDADRHASAGGRRFQFGRRRARLVAQVRRDHQLRIAGDFACEGDRQIGGFPIRQLSLGRGAQDPEQPSELRLSPFSNCATVCSAQASTSGTRSEGCGSKYRWVGCETLSEAIFRSAATWAPVNDSPPTASSAPEGVRAHTGLSRMKNGMQSARIPCMIGRL